jgi:hypothetical protein
MKVGSGIPTRTEPATDAARSTIGSRRVDRTVHSMHASMNGRYRYAANQWLLL